MNRYWAAALVILVATSVSADEPSVEIPLDRIWAFDMPGTRDVAGIPLPEVDEKRRPGLDHERYRNERANLIEQMRQYLTAKPSSVQAMPGFVVPHGVDIHTLRQASNRLAISKKLGHTYPLEQIPAIEFPVSEEDVTLVFYSHPAAYHVRLTKVERQGHDIVVRYRFQPHAYVESTVHFALIPLGKLPAGKYQVNYEQERFEQKYHDAGFLRVHEGQEHHLICRPFSFTIFEPPSPDLAKPEEGAVQIPLKDIWTDRGPGTRDIAELEPMPEGQRNSSGPLLQAIREKLMAYRYKPGDQAGKGFAVNGSGLDALKEAKETIAGVRRRPEKLPAGEVTLVFYAHRRGPAVVVDAIERKDQVFTIKWHFALHESRDSTASIALIPAGDLAAGTYEVRSVQLPATSNGTTDGVRPYSPAFVKQIVCQPFSFRCENPAPDAQP